MRPAAAFAVGLWIGALLALGVAAFNWRAWQRSHLSPPPESAAALQSKDEEIQNLKRQLATVSVEVQQLRRSIVETKNTLNAQAPAAPDRPARRVPFRQPQPQALPVAQQWILNATLNPNSTAMAELEQAASQNDFLALEALALLADRDGGEALMRVWNAETLSASGRIQATRLIAATVELQTEGWTWLQNLASSPEVDRQWLIAALVGLANPAFPSRLHEQDPSIEAPPRFAVDVTTRLKVFDSIRAFSGNRTSETINRMRADLAAIATQ